MFHEMHWASQQERRNLGQAHRKKVGRQQHDQLNPQARPASALELLETAGKGRVPALLKIKYRLMAQSPFSYFRGAVPVMAADLSALRNTGIVTQLCGDAHVRNLGAFAAPDGRLVFDINDFDETIRGPFEWDLKRMAASLVLAGRESGHKDAASRAAVEKCIERYASLMREFAEMPLMEIGRYQVHRISSVAPIHQALLKAERATPCRNLEELTQPAKPKSKLPRLFREIPPVLTRVKGRDAQAVLRALKPYRDMLEPQRQHLLSMYRPIDVAFKVVGTGSVGTRDYCVYFEGNGPSDPLFLQIKEETASGYAPYLPHAHPARHNGQRAVEGQRAMQLQSDPFLGWTRLGGRDFLVRQLNDHKGSINLESMAGKGLEAFAQVCGELLARGHARSCDPLVLSGYLGSGNAFAESLARFGQLYADQTEKDFEELRKSGKANLATVQKKSAKKAGRKS